MTSIQPPKRLPDKPSDEHLRKQAKRLAKAEGIKLADAQHLLALDYGYRRWDELMQAVAQATDQSLVNDSDAATLSRLSKAARDGDESAVDRLLREGEAAGGTSIDTYPPLWHACRSEAAAAARIAIATRLLDAGASPRHDGKGQVTPLHAAAWHGPLALIELLIRRGALIWQADIGRRLPIDYARKGSAPDKAAIVELLDRPVIRDPRFREAVRLIDMGDLVGFTRHIDEYPNLLRENAIEPDCYPRDYFRDPRLFWFIAENPTRPTRKADNVVDFARAMVRRKVEKADLDYALELTMTSSAARERGTQIPLITLLVESGAVATPKAILMTLGHRELQPVEALLSRGFGKTAPIAAAFGETEVLQDLLLEATAEDKWAALGMAVINGRLDAARACLDAGADPNAFLPVHAHSTPMHQAAVDGDVAMLKLLALHGARTDIHDTLWNSTPLGWAVHTGKKDAEAYLRSLKA